MQHIFHNLQRTFTVFNLDFCRLDDVTLAQNKFFNGNRRGSVKGFGGGEIMENKAGWHHKVPNDAEYEAISAELNRRKEEAKHE